MSEFTPPHFDITKLETFTIDTRSYIRYPILWPQSNVEEIKCASPIAVDNDDEPVTCADDVNVENQ